MARGNNRMPIFLDDLDYVRFLEILGKTISKYEINAWLVCPMPNHFHLVFRTRQPNLSLAVGYLNGTYARWWNTRHGRVGHMFQGRFKAQVVEATVYLVRLCRYILLNPVRAGLCAHPDEWPWSSYHALAGTTSSDGVDVESLLCQVDRENPERARARLLDYVEPESDPDIAAFIRSDRRVIGSDTFAAQFRSVARRAPKEVPVRDRRVGTSALVEILADAVRRGEGLPGGVRRAHEASYSVSDIARCAGLARDTVQRIVNGRVRAARSPGTRRPSNADLAPSGPANADLAPDGHANADLTPDRGVSASGAGRGST
jgi:putative transposase